MRNEGRKGPGLWTSAVSVLATLAALVALKSTAAFIYATRYGRFPAMMIAMMGSQIMEFNPGIAGYYERIFSREATDIARPSGSGTKEQTSASHAVLHRKFPAMMIELLGSRAVALHAEIESHYDHIFTREQKLVARRSTSAIADSVKTNSPPLGEYEHTFRVYGLPPQTRDLNSFGFVGREWSEHKPPNTRRVVILGDSVSQGWGVNLNQTYGTLLEERLNSTQGGGRSEQFEILSLSVIGYDLTQILDVAEEDAPRFEPDVYLLPLTELSVFRNWDRHLVLLTELGIDPRYEFLRETLRLVHASESDSSDQLFSKLAPFRIAVVRESLREIKAVADIHHAQFLVVLLPSVEDADITTKRFTGIPELLASLHITYVDLSDTFDGILNRDALRFNPEDAHPNARGHAMIANNLYAKLRANPKAWNALVGSGTENSDFDRSTMATLSAH
jgi:lysophospholipase L1-like esterase